MRRWLAYYFKWEGKAKLSNGDMDETSHEANEQQQQQVSRSCGQLMSGCSVDDKEAIRPGAE